MRRTLLILAVLAACTCSAQNWALLNPAHTYNYGIGGSSLITEQVFVTSTDTLAPDSFRFDLNTIAAACDTCTTTLNGFTYTNGIIITGQPQFLGLHCTTNGADWSFDLGDRRILVKNTVPQGTNWLLDTAMAITATMGATTAGTLFGNADSLRTIHLSSSDSIVLSRSWGIQRMPELGTALVHRLQGEQTSLIGSLLPGLAEYFPYQAGDSVEYSALVDVHNGAGQYWSTTTLALRYIITGRADFTDSIHFDVVRRYRRTFNSPGAPTPDLVINDTTTWSVTEHSLPAMSLMQSFPGQLVPVGERWSPLAAAPDTTFCVAEHLEYAAHVVQAKAMPHRFYVSSDDTARLIPCYDDPGPIELEYRTQRGFDHLIIMLGSDPYDHYYNRFEWKGSSIDGMLEGTWSNASTWVGLTERNMDPHFRLFPNPSSDHLVLDHTADMRGEWLIHDLLGERALGGALNTDTQQAIDLSTLAPGAYLFSLNTAEGRSTQRFIIAR